MQFFVSLKPVRHGGLFRAAAMAGEIKETYSCECRFDRLPRNHPSLKLQPKLTQHSLVRSLKNSLSGLASAWDTERALRLEVAVLVAAIPAACLLTPDIFRRAELIASLLAVLAVELLNTSVEKLCDRTVPQIDPIIKTVKDMGSAAVFCARAMAFVLWTGAAFARFAAC